MIPQHRYRMTLARARRLLTWLAPLQFSRQRPIGAFDYAVLPAPQHHTDGISYAGDQVEPESYWGGWSLNFALGADVTLHPNDFVAPRLYLPLGETGDIFNHPECLVFLDGEIVGSADRHHHELPVPEHFIDGHSHRLTLIGWTGLSGWPHDPNAKTKLFMRTCTLMDVNAPLRDFTRRLTVAIEVFEAASNPRVLDAIDAALRALDTRHPMDDGRLAASLPRATEALTAGLANAAPASPQRLHGVGHAHMDIAYLWQVDQTRAKLGRTFSNALMLMQRYPEFTFTQSQPQLYRYFEDDYPTLFADIKARIHEGRWECTGGMWVEPDCNIPSGESLVRQLLLGRGYFQSRFGEVDTPVLFLPDTFGFNHQLPQLMKLSGLEYFLTNKTNWNQYNRLPWQSFVWRGLDGSEVIAQTFTTPRDVQYLPHPTTYKAELSAQEVFGTAAETHQPEAQDELLIAYGYGDGGGGPTESLLERARLFSDQPDMPRFESSRLDHYFDQLKSKQSSLPVWERELYLELHRGTYTSQASIKRANRLAERRLKRLEWLCAMAAWDGQPYPADGFQQAWELVCLNQFHDILPGTAIAEVFADAHRDYRRVDAILDGLESALTSEPGHTLVNPSAVPQSLVLVTGATAEALNLPAQTVEGGALVAVALPGYSQQPLQLCQPAPVDASLSYAADGDGFVLTNARASYRLNGAGQLVSARRTGGTETLSGVGNQWQCFDDRPVCWDAWDIDAYFEDHQTNLDAPVDYEWIETGPLRLRLRATRRWQSSSIVQDFILAGDCARLDIETQVDWREANTLVKVAFPTTIDTDLARYDIQWGNIERPAHRNTAEAAAMFEVPAQRWADLSDGAEGFALLNDCKYGYDAVDGVLRLTLIKSSTSPDPHADQGLHRFTYSVLPHPGDHCGEVIDHGHRIADPAVCLDRSLIVSGERPRWSTSAGVTVATVKWAEDGNGLILRAFEAYGRPGTLRLSHSATVCDLLERALDPSGANATEFTLSPFQILTLRVHRPG